MSFRDKFEGKINTVNKRGIKHTLFGSAFNGKEETLPRHRYTFSHSKQPHMEGKEEEPLLQRRATFEELPSKKENNCIASFMSRPLLEKGHHKKTASLFIDEMLDKHRNLLRIIDHKTSYRIARTK